MELSFVDCKGSAKSFRVSRLELEPFCIFLLRIGFGCDVVTWIWGREHEKDIQGSSGFENKGYIWPQKLVGYKKYEFSCNWRMFRCIRLRFIHVPRTPPKSWTVLFIIKELAFAHTLLGTNIFHLGNRKIMFTSVLAGDMLVPWRVGNSSINRIYLGTTPDPGCQAPPGLRTIFSRETQPKPLFVTGWVGVRTHVYI